MVNNISNRTYFIPLDSSAGPLIIPGTEDASLNVVVTDVFKNILYYVQSSLTFVEGLEAARWPQNPAALRLLILSPGPFLRPLTQ